MLYQLSYTPKAGARRRRAPWPGQAANDPGVRRNGAERRRALGVVAPNRQRHRRRHMTMNSLKDVYLDQLQDLYSACKQSLDATTKLGRAAGDKDLSEALIDGAQGISSGMEKIANLCSDHGIDPTGEHCKGMEGLVAEAHAHALDEKFGSDEVRDAMIITQYQRMVHYAMAGYGCVVAFANRLGFDGDAAVLQEMLDQTYDGDRRMTHIATQGGINAEAA
ncbi:ferritin-like domain-containing protein [Rhodobacteraceae bacterium CCMM004]|nr:ferritin-like domain-containing protein [Rhodobacteraceae bacterium CCMM004]